MSQLKAMMNTNILASIAQFNKLRTMLREKSTEIYINTVAKTYKKEKDTEVIVIEYSYELDDEDKWVLYNTEWHQTESKYKKEVK